MKVGDVVVLKRDLHYANNSVGVPWVHDNNKPHLTLIEGKADIGGCVLARDAEGKVRCINPDLFEVVYTAEEAVAKRLMEPGPVAFESVSLSEPAARFNQVLMGNMARVVAKDLDDKIIADMAKGWRRAK